MQLILKERDLGVEENRIGSSEFSNGDHMCWIRLVAFYPLDLCAARARGSVARVDGRISPVIGFCRRRLGHRDLRIRACPAYSVLESGNHLKVGMASRTYRLCNHLSAYPTFTPPSPSTNSPFLTPLNAASVVHIYFQTPSPFSLSPPNTSSSEFSPNVISGSGNPRLACRASQDEAFDIGFVVAVIFQFDTLMERELGDSESECLGTGTAEDIRTRWTWL